MKPQDRGSPVKPNVGGAKAELTGQRVDLERREQRLEAEPQDPLALTLLVVARTAGRRHCRASPEMAQGCKHPGLEDWPSFAVMVAIRILTE